MFGSRRSTLLRAVVVVFAVLQLVMWTGDDVPLLRLRRMKLAALGSSDHEEDPPVDVPQSLGLVACDGSIHRL
jgi:hypothetical protein